MKNHDKVIANYVKLFTKKKSKSLILQIEDLKDSTPSSSSKYKFCKKEYRPNEC